MNAITTIDPGGSDANTPARAAGDEPAPTRQCGRCRAHFPVAPGTHPFELQGWWACPTCSGALLPDQHHRDEQDGVSMPTVPS